MPSGHPAWIWELRLSAMNAAHTYSECTLCPNSSGVLKQSLFSEYPSPKYTLMVPFCLLFDSSILGTYHAYPLPKGFLYCQGPAFLQWKLLLFPSHPNAEPACHLLPFGRTHVWSHTHSLSCDLLVFPKHRLQGLEETSVMPSSTYLFGETEAQRGVLTYLKWNSALL